MSLSPPISTMSNFTLVIFSSTIIAKGRVSRRTYYISKGPLTTFG